MSKNRLEICLRMKYTPYKRIRFVTRTLFVCGIFLLLTSCGPGFAGPKPTPTEIPLGFQDRSWLTGIPCEPPCWYGLLPDISTEAEALEVLSTLPFIDPTTMLTLSAGFRDKLTGEYYSATGIEVSYRIQLDGQGYVSLTIADGVLKYIRESLNFDITLKEIVNYIGPPDYVEASEQPVIKGSPYCSVELIWVDRQLVAVYAVGDQDTWLDDCAAINNGVPINPDTVIPFISILYENSINSFMKNQTGLPWPGFSDS